MITTIRDKVNIVDDVYDILYENYKSVKGGLHFSSKDELITKTDKWKVIYYDAQIVGVVIYKAKQGLKMVAMGIHTIIEKNLRYVTKQMLVKIFKFTFSHTWMEVSEAAEKFILKNGGDNFLIPNKLAKQLTGKEILELCEDGYHYTREINGIIKTKVMIGTPKY
jgi:hypothetical protein